MLNRCLLLIVISAPSGTGKTTVVKELFKSINNIKRSISFTTRPPKTGEVKNKDYFFISEEEFKRKIKRNKFVEYAMVHGYLYGTPKSFLDCADKKDIIFNIDIQGGFAIKKKFPSAILIFLIPPSFKELKKRLLKRNRDTDEDIKNRLKNAKKEIKFLKKYDFLVINDKLKDAVEKIKSIIISERCIIKKADKFLRL